MNQKERALTALEQFEGKISEKDLNVRISASTNVWAEFRQDKLVLLINRPGSPQIVCEGNDEQTIEKTKELL